MTTNPRSEQQESDIKLYTTNWVCYAAAFGGPIAGAYLMSKNFAYLGNKPYAKKTLLWGVVVTCLTGVMVPNALIPAISAGVMHHFMRAYQGKAIKNHLENNGKTQSGWKAFGLSFICTPITLLFYILGAILVEAVKYFLL